MRIDLNAGVVTSESQLGSRTEKSSNSRAGSAAGGETRFSAGHNSVAALAASVLSAPEVRSDKVEALRTQIAFGRYQVSAQQVAASLLEQLRSV